MFYCASRNSINHVTSTYYLAISQQMAALLFASVGPVNCHFAELGS